MKVSCNKGIASHVGPESCGGIREDAVEALTGESAGRVLSLENAILWGADAVLSCGRQQRSSRNARIDRIPRGHRPCARIEASHKEAKVLRSEAGRSRVRLGFRIQVRAVNPKGHDGDARTREVGQAHSTCEVPEQGWHAAARGGDGGKGPGQGEFRR